MQCHKITRTFKVRTDLSCNESPIHIPSCSITYILVGDSPTREGPGYATDKHTPTHKSTAIQTLNTGGKMITIKLPES